MKTNLNHSISLILGYVSYVMFIYVYVGVGVGVSSMKCIFVFSITRKIVMDVSYMKQYMKTGSQSLFIVLFFVSS